jgi:hypothetical protein
VRIRPRPDICYNRSIWVRHAWTAPNANIRKYEAQAGGAGSTFANAPAKPIRQDSQLYQRPGNSLPPSDFATTTTSAFLAVRSATGEDGRVLSRKEDRLTGAWSGVRAER